MLKLDYFSSGYFKQKYLGTKKYEDILSLDSFFETEVYWYAFQENKPSKKTDNVYLVELATVSDFQEKLFISAFSIDSEEAFEECEVIDSINVVEINSEEDISIVSFKQLTNIADEEIILSLVMSNLI